MRLPKLLRLLLGLALVAATALDEAVVAGMAGAADPAPGAFSHLPGRAPHPAGEVIPAASCSLAAIQAAIASAGGGDTVTVPAGNCTWNNALLLPDDKKITLQGAGKDATIINGELDLTGPDPG